LRRGSSRFAGEAGGLDAAPAAFIGLLRGENFGKQLVELV
jgi:NADPH-dependent curcumin reductase CurA